jgi:hypothetical protein
MGRSSFYRFAEKKEEVVNGGRKELSRKALQLTSRHLLFHLCFRLVFSKNMKLKKFCFLKPSDVNMSGCMLAQGNNRQSTTDQQ